MSTMNPPRHTPNQTPPHTANQTPTQTWAALADRLLGASAQRRHISAVVLTVLSLLLGTVLGGQPAQAAAAAVPPTPSGLPAGVEALAGYVPAASCDAQAKGGTVAFAEMLKATSGVGYNIPRGCGADALSTSEHYDGRAVDWSVTVREATSKAKATAVINWLLATDAAGNPYANARRLGVMYIIWDGKIWGSYRPGDSWREYNGCSKTTTTATDTTCHRDHVHFSLSWEGANKHTSWWTKTVARPEFGPCRVADLNWAPPRSSANYSPCPTYPKVAAATTASALGKSLVGYSGMYLAQGSSGPATRALQSAIGATADGAFGSGTKASLITWQKGHAVPATGVTDVATWRALIKGYLPGSGTVTVPATPSPPPPAPVVLGKPGVGLDGDNRADVVARRPDGSLWLYSGTGAGTVRAGRQIGSGWHGYTTVLSPGDFTGDGRRDIIAAKSTGALYLHTGNGLGGLSAAKVIGSGWQGFNLITSPGDFTGDGKTDLIARTPAGKLYLYAGNGTGGFAAPGKVIGSGWQMFNTITSPGDFTGDGKTDLIARTPAGQAVPVRRQRHRWVRRPGQGHRQRLADVQHRHRRRRPDL